ncbi:MAG: tetratricopeptide repeat protein [Bacteroidales bacterium]|jgi:Flp pilus assembly protein TadD|nr:hypothetical protein [Bacteroidales bacterium]
MKKISLKLTILFVISAAMFSGCGLKKMVKKYPEVRYEVKPEVLETHGGKVTVSVSGRVPAKYFRKKATMVVTPVLRTEQGTLELKSIYLKGEKAEGEGTVIGRKNGGSFSYTDTFDYDPKFNSSELYAQATARTKKKTAVMPEVKFADGIIYTSQRVIVKPDLSSKDKPGSGTSLMVADHGYEKEVIITETASIYYKVDLSNLDWRLDLNKDAKEELEKFMDFVYKQYEVKEFTLNAWASPEGEESRNIKLSEARSKTAMNWYESEIRSYKQKKAREERIRLRDVQLDIPEITAKANGEDWAGFMRAVENSNLRDKNAILNVVRNQPDVSRREQEIRNMTVIYKEIEDNILPPLRRATFKMSCLEPRKADSEIANLATSNPKELDNKEIFYAATLTEDMATKERIYRNAIEVYPEDWRGYNDLATVLIMQNKYDEAKTLAEKANTLSPNNGLVLNNLGVLAMLNGDWVSAKSYIESSSQNGVNQNYNLAMFSVKEGDYQKAVGLFGNKTCDYNLALAQILSSNNSAAVQNLECIKDKSAEVYYLLAVANARLGNKNGITSNLKKACDMDAKYKAEAKDDREFMKYFSDSDFINAIR